MNKIGVTINREATPYNSLVEVKIPWAYTKNEPFYLGNKGEYCELNNITVKNFTQRLTLANYVRVVSDRIDSSTSINNTELISFRLFKKARIDCDGITFSVYKNDMSKPPIMYLFGDDSLRIVWVEFDAIRCSKCLDPISFAIVQEKYLPEINYVSNKENRQKSVSIKVKWAYCVKDAQILMYRNGILYDSGRTLKENIDYLSELVGGFENTNKFYGVTMYANRGVLGDDLISIQSIHAVMKPVTQQQYNISMYSEVTMRIDNIDEDGIEFSLVGNIAPRIVTELSSGKYVASFIWGIRHTEESDILIASPHGISIIPEHEHTSEIFYRDNSIKNHY